ncbi:hypothetical protein D3C87_101680 [compost metagenome]
MIRHGLIIFLLGISMVTEAYEVDNFTERHHPLKDSRDVLNKEVNRRLEQAMKITDARARRNKTGRCRDDDLYDAVKSSVGGGVIGSLETFADSNKDVDKHVEQKSNIYSNRSSEDKRSGFVMSVAGLNSSINVNGEYIGADKLGHFFDEGYDYYRQAKRKDNFQEGIKEALVYGHDLESGMLGFATTGIKSYGDLVANYSGLQFWMSLRGGAKPYFQCQAGKWVQIRDFDFADYVNAGWDEAINCSEYESPTMEEAVREKAKKYEKWSQANSKPKKFVCPVSPKACVKLKELYGPKAENLLGLPCFSAKDDGTESGHYSAQVPSSNAKSSSSTNTAPPVGGTR